VALVPLLGSRTVAQTPTRPGAEAGRYLFSDLAERVIPSVVTVYVKRDMRKEMDPQTLERLKEFQKQYRGMDPFLRQLIPFNVPGQDGEDDENDNGNLPEDAEQWITKGSGSGVIVSADGYVVTNWHVVGEKKNNPEIRVVLSDNTELSGKDVQLIESSKLADLALLKINRSGLKPIAFGDSEKMRIGEWVAAIGSPLDLRLTVTQGIICAKHREIDSAAGLGSMLQTDAVINPGSSGGALVNLDGQLIGINRLITTPFQGREAWSGYGFAIPSNDVKQFVDTVLKSGKITYGYIGVGVANEFQDSPKLRQALGLDKDQKGALVIKVTPGAPAAAAGLQEGDMIVAADGKPIENYNDLISTVARRNVGTTVHLKVLRPQENASPREMTINLKVAERPSEEQLEQVLRGGDKGQGQPKPQVREENNLGVRVEPYNEGGRQGVKIMEVQPGSPAARAGLQEGDVIYEINFKPIRTAQDIDKALKRTDKPHLIRYLRDGNPGLVAIDQNSMGRGGRKR
jgi:serine protease Do